MSRMVSASSVAARLRSSLEIAERSADDYIRETRPDKPERVKREYFTGALYGLLMALAEEYER